MLLNLIYLNMNNKSFPDDDFSDILSLIFISLQLQWSILSPKAYKLPKSAWIKLAHDLSFKLADD